MGRAELKRLKQSTLKTMFDILGSGKDGIFGFERDKDYFYNSIEGTLKFPSYGNSEIVLQDMKQQPSDLEYDTLGSTEYTGAFLDEISEIPLKAKQVLLTRLRYKIDEFGIIGKLLYCTNPCKHWAYDEFYKAKRDKKIRSTRVFIQALAKDNPHIPKTYIKSLERADNITKQRLLYGNWEYSEDPTHLFDYDASVDMFTNNAERGLKYLTIDVAGRGRDKTVLVYWEGLFIYKIEIMDNISSKELDERLQEEKIPRSRCIADEDGVGFGLVKNLPGIKGFVNNASPLKNKREAKTKMKNYKNLKAQCWFELAHYVNNGMIGIYRKVPSEIKESLISDLEQIKQKDPDKDQPLRIVSKEEIKAMIGRSTDVGDAVMMRMMDLVKTPVTTV